MTNPLPDPTQKYYTVPEVAELLRVHVNSVYRWVRLRRLKSYHIASSVRISQAQLDDFVQPRRRRTQKKAT